MLNPKISETQRWHRSAIQTSHAHHTWANPAYLNTSLGGYFGALKHQPQKNYRMCSVPAASGFQHCCRCPSLGSGICRSRSSGWACSRERKRSAAWIIPAQTHRDLSPDKPRCSLQVSFVLKDLQNYIRAILCSWSESRLSPCVLTNNYTTTILSFAWKTFC